MDQDNTWIYDDLGHTSCGTRSPRGPRQSPQYTAANESASGKAQRAALIASSGSRDVEDFLNEVSTNDCGKDSSDGPIRDFGPSPATVEATHSSPARLKGIDEMEYRITQVAHTVYARPSVHDDDTYSIAAFKTRCNNQLIVLLEKRAERNARQSSSFEAELIPERHHRVCSKPHSKR